MKILKRIGILFLIVLVGIQFIPTTRNESKAVLPSDFMETFKPPENIAQQIKTSCYDCHSNNTIYPWYNKIQPIRWFLEHHINEAKEELNFSEFGDYSKRRQKNKLKSIISQIKDNEMPLFSYSIMHGDAKLTQSKKREIIKYIDKLRDNL